MWECTKCLLHEPDNMHSSRLVLIQYGRELNRIQWSSQTVHFYIYAHWPRQLVTKMGDQVIMKQLKGVFCIASGDF